MKKMLAKVIVMLSLVLAPGPAANTSSGVSPVDHFSGQRLHVVAGQTRTERRAWLAQSRIQSCGLHGPVCGPDLEPIL